MPNLKIFSVSEYIGELNTTLKEQAAVVEGEISEYRINQGKWIFFKVKDESSVLDCFSTVFKLKFPLADGMRVRLYGKPSIYAKSGKFSMTVEWAEPVGEGALKKAFELLKVELQKEGLFSLERKRSLPQFPKTIGLIASRESAAYGDFVKVLQERFGGIAIHLFHAQVQGSGAIESISEAFSYFNQHAKELGLDFIVLIRGGGALEDLMAFNSREVAQAIFGSVVPVVCGVGHERDETIADYVADIRASTPSNAAELISPNRADLLYTVERKVSVMVSYIEALHQNKTQSIERAITRLDIVMSAKAHAFKTLTQTMFHHLKFFEEGIIMQRLKIDGFVRLLSNISPMAVLEKGYAIVKKGGKVITKISQLASGDMIEFTLKDGVKKAKIS